MYAKLFASLYQGTLRGRSDEILVFTNLLAHAEADGTVDKHWRAIAEETGLSEDRVKAAILELEKPDPESRSPEMDGCRLVRLDGHRAWGWLIVNHGKYRSIRHEEDRREQNRLAQQRFRRKQSKPPSAERKQSKPHKPPSSHADADADADAEKKRGERATRLPDDFCLTDERRKIAESENLSPERTFEKFANYWRGIGGQRGRKLNWDTTWRNWCMNETDRRPNNGRRNGLPLDERNSTERAIAELLGR